MKGLSLSLTLLLAFGVLLSLGASVKNAAVEEVIPAKDGPSGVEIGKIVGEAMAAAEGSVTKSKSDKILDTIMYSALGFIVVVFGLTLSVFGWCMTLKSNPEVANAANIEAARQSMQWRNDSLSQSQMTTLSNLHRSAVAVGDARLTMASKRLSQVEDKIRETQSVFQDIQEVERRATAATI